MKITYNLIVFKNYLIFDLSTIYLLGTALSSDGVTRFRCCMVLPLLGTSKLPGESLYSRCVTV